MPRSCASSGSSPRPRTTSSWSATTTRRSTPGASPMSGASCASSSDYPAARRVMLATNYRCPAAVIEASARMVAVNRERFAKPIRAPARRRGTSPAAISAVSTADPRWPRRMAQLAAAEDRAGRTLLLPVAHARRADAGPPRARRAPASGTRPPSRRSSRPNPCSSSSWPRAPQTMAAIRSTSCDGSAPRAAGIAAARPATCSPTRIMRRSTRSSAGPPRSARSTHSSTPSPARERGSPRCGIPDARVELATVHASKGREWETVVLVGFEADRIPNRRTLRGRR